MSYESDPLLLQESALAFGFHQTGMFGFRTVEKYLIAHTGMFRATVRLIAAVQIVTSFPEHSRAN